MSRPGRKRRLGGRTFCVACAGRLTDGVCSNPECIGCPPWLKRPELGKLNAEAREP